MIKTQKLVKTYGEGELALTVLKHLDLEIKSGEFVAIIGPSGAGKSTLLYQMSLLDVPTSGEIFIDGKETSGLGDVEKTALRLNKLGYVFQDYALLPELTALENVLLPMMVQRMDPVLATTKAEKALAKVNLSDKLKSKPAQLSGGQQQRVAIARAIAHDPQILFADEPTANLDSASADPVMAAFLEINRAGQTIIMVTHEEEYAKKAQRVIALKDGVIVSDKYQR
jgi:putative ABC transport system ATP-binding protein